MVSGGPTLRGGRSVKGVLLLLVAAILLVGLIVFFSDDESGVNEPLDPQSWRKDGGHALVELLRRQGVEVRVVRTVDEARAAASGDTLFFVSNSSYLDGEETLRQVGEIPGDRVVLNSYYALFRQLAPGVRSEITGDSERREREPNCTWSGAERAGAVALGGLPNLAPDTLDSCYGGLVLRYRKDGRIITVLSDSSIMTNAGVAEPGAAALALNILGTRRTVVWLAPSAPQSKGEKVGPDLLSLVPDRVWWATRTLVVAVVATALWQARRLGPVIVERLPVVVRASETSEGLGRLYQARRARDRAAGALRKATVARLAKRLAVPARSLDSMTPVLAARAGRTPEEIRWVLYGPDPADDWELVALAEQLNRLEVEIVEHGVLEGKVRGA